MKQLIIVLTIVFSLFLGCSESEKEYVDINLKLIDGTWKREMYLIPKGSKLAISVSEKNYALVYYSETNRVNVVRYAVIDFVVLKRIQKK